MGQAVSEKMKPDEDPKVAMIRGIQEELGSSGEIALSEMGTDVQQTNSSSYPGLKSEYISHKFQAELTDKQFNPGGYVEDQPDKSTFFIWEKVE